MSDRSLLRWHELVGNIAEDQQGIDKMRRGLLDDAERVAKSRRAIAESHKLMTGVDDLLDADSVVFGSPL